MLKQGNKAPDFTLLSHDGRKVSLSDFAGKSDVILYFYPKDNTSGCTKEACSFRDNIETIEAKGAVVLGVSPDSVKSHQNFIQKQSLNFTLLSDPDHQVAEAYGAWGEKSMYGKKYMGIIRSTFIIGKDGVIKYVFEKVKVESHATDVITILKD
jgi:peroxiredoxin Q/BCP